MSFLAYVASDCADCDVRIDAGDLIQRVHEDDPELGYRHAHCPTGQDALGVDPATLTDEAAWPLAQADGYFLTRTLIGGVWGAAWGKGDEIYGDGYGHNADARAAAVDDWRSRQPEWCERCGDQAVCPECVGA